MLNAAIKPYVGLGGHFVSFKRTFEKAENECGESGKKIEKEDSNKKFLINKSNIAQRYGGGGQVSAGLVYDLNERVFIGTELALGYQGVKTNPYMQSSFFGNLQGSIGMRLPKDFQVCLSAGIEVDRFISIAIEGTENKLIVSDTDLNELDRSTSIGREAKEPSKKSVASSVSQAPSHHAASSVVVPPTHHSAKSSSVEGRPPPPEGDHIYFEADETYESYDLKTSQEALYIPSGIISISISKKIRDTWFVRIEGQLTNSFLTSYKRDVESEKHNLFFNLSQKRIIVSVVKFL